jgi:hypothetical protein
MDQKNNFIRFLQISYESMSVHGKEVFKQYIYAQQKNKDSCC